MKFYSSNIRSINTAFHEIRNLVTQRQTALFIQELWNPKTSSHIHSYSTHFQVRSSANKKRGGGIGHYIHNTIKNETLQIAQGLPDELEIYSCKISFKSCQFIITNIYRPPVKITEKFWDHLSDTLKKLFDTYPNENHIFR